jgi:Bacteriophage clamp loader A subunit
MSKSETTKQDTPFTMALNSLNKNKTNIIRNEEIREKDYPTFVTARMMAHYPDCVLFVNDVNVSGIQARRHFEYLLHSVTKKNRYTKYEKPKNSEYAEFVMQMLNCSRRVAEQYLEVLSDEALNEVKSLKKKWLETST